MSDLNWVFVLAVIFTAVTLLIPAINQTLETTNQVIGSETENIITYNTVDLDVEQITWFGLSSTPVTSLSVTQQDPVSLYEDPNVINIGLDIDNNVMRLQSFEANVNYNLILQLDSVEEGVINDTIRLVVMVRDDAFDLNNPTRITNELIGSGVSRIDLGFNEVFEFNLNYYSDLYVNPQSIQNNKFINNYVNGISNMPIAFNVFYFGILTTMLTIIILRWIRGQ